MKGSERVGGMKSFVAALVFMGATLVLAEEYEGEYELGYIGLNINKVIESEFFPVYIDYKNEEPYIGLKSFFTFIGADDMKVDLEDLTAKGRIGERYYDLDLKQARYIMGEKEIFIRGGDYGKLFKSKKIEWDTERYVWSLELTFQTPYEILTEAEERISGIGADDEEEVDPEKIYSMDRKLFSPGILRLRYTDLDIGEGDDSISMRYDNSLLYGDFSMNYFFEPESELGNITLRYNDVIEDKSILFGDTFPRTYDFLNTSKVRGFAIERWDPDNNLELSNTEIKGFAPFRSTVELYRNDGLIAFTIVDQDNTYTFDNIRIQGFEDVYTVKIYTYEGTVETRSVSIYTDNKVLEKGKIDYDVFVGQSPDDDLEDKDETQYQLKGYYGVTDRLTLGVGYMNIVSEIDDEDDDIFDSDLIEDDDDDETTESIVSSLVDTSLYYTSPPIKYPIYLELSNLYDTDEGENTQIAKYRQKFGRHYLSLEGYLYGDKMSIVTEAEEQYEIAWRGPVKDRWSYSVSATHVGEVDDDDTDYLFGELFYNNRDISHTFGLAYPVSSSTDDNLIANYQFLHSGLEIFKLPINLNMEATVDVEEASENALYRIGIKKRGDRRSDVSLSVDYDTDDVFVVFSVSYKLTNWLEILGEFTKDADDTDFAGGVDIEKSIILEKPFAKTSNPDPDTSWIEGSVFIDADGDGIRDEGEKPLEGVGIKVGRNESITDEEGRYFIDDISPYEVEKFEIDSETIDPLVRSAQPKTHVRTTPARGGRLDIPVQPISVIMGMVNFNYEGFSEIESYSISSKLFVTLKDKSGRVVKEKRIEPEGFYVMEEILPGDYVVHLEYRGNENVELDKEEIPVTIQSGDYGDYYSGNDFSIIRVEEE